MSDLSERRIDGDGRSDTTLAGPGVPATVRGGGGERLRWVARRVGVGHGEGNPYVPKAPKAQAAELKAQAAPDELARARGRRPASPPEGPARPFDLRR